MTSAALTERIKEETTESKLIRNQISQANEGYPIGCLSRPPIIWIGIEVKRDLKTERYSDSGIRKTESNTVLRLRFLSILRRTRPRVSEHQSNRNDDSIDEPVGNEVMHPKCRSRPENGQSRNDKRETNLLFRSEIHVEFWHAEIERDAVPEFFKNSLSLPGIEFKTYFWRIRGKLTHLVTRTELFA